MDTELLKTFLEVRRTRHFGRAAENLYLTQAAVSARIRQLEGMLGVTLFHRHRNNIQLTPAGERLVPHAEAMLVAWARARQEIALSDERRIQISLASTPGLWDIFLQRRLNALHQAHPDLALRAEAHSAAMMGRMLMERTLDVAISFEPPKIEDVKSEKIEAFELVLVSTNPDASVPAIFDQGYVFVDWGTQFNIIHAKTFSEQPPPVLRTTMSRIALEFILQNGGAAYLARPMLEGLMGKQLHPVANAPVIPREVFAVYREFSEKQQELHQVLDILMDTRIR